MSDAPSAFPEGAFARRAGLISRGSACSYSPKGGWADGGLRDAGLHLPLGARVFISRRERPDRSSVAEVAPGRAARGRCGIR